MSTRAIYTFKDDDRTVHVYKHHDGYPSGALSFIAAAKEHAWALPRFEADEFSGAFVAACKIQAHESRKKYGHYSGGGGIRLIGSGEPHEFAVDTAYLYEITCKEGKLQVAVYDTDGEGKRGKLLKSGTLEAVTKWAEKYQA